MNSMKYTLGIDIGSTTVKIAILDEAHSLLFADYENMQITPTIFENKTLICYDSKSLYHRLKKYGISRPNLLPHSR